MSLEVVPNLKEILINSTIQNVKSNIIKLKEFFSTSSNIQYLEYWFIFFEKDFFKKNLKIMEKQYQWMQKFLVKVKDEVINDERKELKFLSFKFEKENFFSWDKELEFELLEFTLIWEEQKQKEKDKLIDKITALKIELNCKLSSKKWELKEKLYKTDFSPHVLVEGIMKLNEFNNAFQTEQQCLAYIANLKENKCIRCFNFNLNTSDLKRMRCLKCNQTFSILTGTIFSRSQTSLTSWFYLIFRWINTKHGIPSTDIAKELGVTLKTAWRMTHKIRTRIAKQKPQFIVEGTVQIDEMYLSHMGFKKQGRSLVNKTLIVGIYQKTTNNLIVKVLKNAKSKNLLQFAKNHISSKCLVYTDSWKGYCDFKSVFTKHETVNHQDGYVSKIGVNTNQIESVWKHIRRTFKTHIKVAKHHVHLYAKEAAYKFNKIPSFETVILCLI
ncbi:hypothetical protein SHM_05330 [Spiroplasma ixodetis]|uniref:ISXO2-like transposase domain-containing protein n=1 Tax=Spiroplasma ixodetis TaxID=2141 RepID=A0ABN6SWL4_9MOLU|nr:hypothetical protein SHM_05330 [Spiroplasma ixodetis]